MGWMVGALEKIVNPHRIRRNIELLFAMSGVVSKDATTPLEVVCFCFAEAKSEAFGRELSSAFRHKLLAR